MKKAGFIGLGSMGAPIARRLARTGFDVTGCDISEVMLDAFDEPGTKRSNDPVQTATEVDWLGVCVRTDDQLQALLGDGEIYSALGEGGMLILHSTVAPELAISLADQATSYGVGFVDVGVSGGEPAALEGKLSLWIGGKEEDVETVRRWLEAIGSNLACLGGVGRGQQGKLLNNLISVANYGMSTAIVDIGLSMGFDRQTLIDALMAGSAQSFALSVGPRFVLPREGGDSTGVYSGLHDLLKKDVEHAAELATSETQALRSLCNAAGFMLTRLRRAASEAEGHPQPADPQLTVENYFSAIAAKDIELLMTLYAEDAAFTLPNGKVFEGKDAIRQMHESVFSAGSPSPEPGQRFVAPEGIAVEINARLPDGSVRNTTNHYRFNDAGKIISLGVYSRG